LGDWWHKRGASSSKKKMVSPDQKISKKSGIRSLAVPEFFWRTVPRCDIIKVLVVNPAALHIIAVVELPDIGFDIDQRCPVQYIDTFYLQDVLFNFKEPDNRESQRVGAVEMAYGKDAPLFFPVKKWFLEKAYVRCAIETVQQIQVRERFDVTQAFGEFREDLNISYGRVKNTLDGSILLFMVLGVDDPYGMEDDLFVMPAFCMLLIHVLSFAFRHIIGLFSGLSIHEN